SDVLANDWSKFSWRLSEDSLLCNVSGSVVSKVRFPPTKDPRTFSVRILAGRGPRCFRNLTIENEQILGCPPLLNRNLFQSTSFECGCDARTLSGAEQLIHHKGYNMSASFSEFIA
ncbi:unnamed protein product, partial [Anisakis simplex]|uniref:Abnormal pharyngeal pumping eat-20 (inferred by orthology to a C. elegans protein) n=1 Tax=Anisakis simplex TaxID=6269 RepID=A0A0M3JBU9_ANISI